MDEERVEGEGGQVIEWFTSTVLPWPVILDAATRYSYEHVLCHEGCRAVLVTEIPHMLPRQQTAWADYAVLAKHRKDPGRRVVVATTSELALLRVLRRVREESKQKEDAQEPLFDHRDIFLRGRDVVVHCLTGQRSEWEKPVVIRRLRVGDNGDFIDPWPDGFFDERMEELF
jgi:hypothetical protein